MRLFLVQFVITAALTGALVTTAILTSGEVNAQIDLPINTDFDEPGKPSVWGDSNTDVQRLIRRQPAVFFVAITETLAEQANPEAVVDPLLKRLGLSLPDGVDPIEDVDTRELNRLIREVERTLGEDAAAAMVTAARESRDAGDDERE